MRDRASPDDRRAALTDVVTGASSGLGRATALRLAAAGADVAVLARTASALADVADAITAESRQALPLACDLADAAGVEHAMQEVERRLGPPTVLVSAAGTDVPAR